MADTPRGPRPTVTRRVAAAIALAWACVAVLLVAAAVVPTTAVEDGWERQRLELVEVPWGSCDGDTCKLRPTVRMPSGDARSVPLVITADEERLPSNHFREGGSLLLWVHDDELPRSTRPVTAAGTIAAWSLLGGALVLAAAAILLTRRASRLHHPARAGHVADHLALRVAPALVLLLAVGLLAWTLDRTTPRHDPRLPAATTGAMEQRSQ